MSSKRKRLEVNNHSTQSTSTDQENEIKRLKLQVEQLERINVQLREDKCRLSEELCEKLSATGRFAEEYKLIDILGSGTFGLVLEAEDSHVTFSYAVKRIAVAPSKYREKLWEAHVFSRLDHPGIVRYNCTWIEKPPEGVQHEEDGKYIRMFPAKRDHIIKMFYKADCHFVYIRMQLCNGSLTNWLDVNTRADSRPLPKMKFWLRQLVAAIGYLHKKEYIYRDLKPCNILIFEETRLKLCDMGIVMKRQQENGAERPQDGPTGSPLYMSPEQVNIFSQVSSKSDIFSLGLLFAELAVVMDTPRKLEVFRKYREGISVNIFGHDLETKRFVDALTQVDPDERPSCQEMLDDLYFEGISRKFD